MNFTRSRLPALVLAACIAASPALRAEPGHVFPPLTPEEIAGIAAAVPAQPRAAAASPRKILVFYRTEGYVHPSISYLNEALRQIGAKTGAYQSDFSDDMAVFTPANLARYDAVVFQNTTGLAFKDPAQRQALLDYVKSGKGFVGIHAASDSFYTWPEGQDLIGGLFHGHPWKSIDTEAVKLDDPTSPVVAAFGGKGFWLREEIYQIVGPYSRAKERVLLSLDMTKAEDYRGPEKLVRTDADFPIAWIKNYGKGRVFYTSIGHNPDLFKQPEILQFYLDGIQFALGDLAADATPRTTPVPAAFPSVPGMALQDRGYRTALPPDYLDKLAAYNFGPIRTPVFSTDIYLRTQGPKVYPKMEQALLGLLARPDLKDGGRDYAIRTLTVIGSAASVPVLASQAGRPRVATLAIDALFAIPGPESEAALLDLLGSTQGPALVTVIGAVGRRGIAAAIPKLTALAASPDRKAAAAALTALGDIGTSESFAALRGAHPAADLAGIQQWAELYAASRAGLRNSETHAMDIEILDSTAPYPLRSAALRALALGSNPLDAAVFQKLRDPDQKIRFTAANLFIGSRHPSDSDRAALVDDFPGLDPAVQLLLMDAVTDRRIPESLPLVSQGLKSADSGIRLAAIVALGSVTLADHRSDPAVIPVLLALLDGSKAETAAAVDSLGRIRTPGIVDALLGAIPGAAPAKKAALLQVLAARVDHRVYPFALAAVDDPNPAVRSAAFTAIAATSRQEDLSTVLALLPKARTVAERRSMERALLDAVRAAPNPDPITDAIAQTLVSTQGAARYSLLIALALTGTDHARAILSEILHSASSQDRREALHAITGARNPRLDVLLVDTARTDPEPNERILALRDYLDMLQVPNGRSEIEINAGYATAWSLATRPEERDAIIAALKHLNTNAADAQIAQLEAPRAKS